MTKLLSTLLLLCATVFAQSQELEIGIWKDGKKTQRFLIHSESDMEWKVDDGVTHTVPSKSSTYFTLEKGRVRLSTAKKTIGHFSKVELVNKAGDIHFNMKSLKPERKESIYSASLAVTVASGSLHLVNSFFDIDSYIAGVVESESGKEQGLEFYKVQSVISRTYALSNIRRHEHEGFNLCDQVHCQVFHGVSRHSDLIPEAAKETKDQVLVDTEIELITASFHSNCGGHTVNSEEVWSKALPYLRGKRDTFCLDGKHSHWEATILKSSWENYLSDQFSVNSNSGLVNPYTYVQPERDEFFLSADLGIERKLLRHKWRLQSTFFNVRDVGEELKVVGRGFGHGVGLCQEGAMNMANKGFKYDEIMLFYYTDVHLTHRSVIDFFRDN